MHSSVLQRGWGWGNVWIGIVPVVCCALLLALPAAAAPWGSKSNEKAKSVRGVDADVVEEHTTIDLPPRTRKSDVEADITDPSLLPAELPQTEYVIGPGDVLSFQSFDDPSLSRPGVVILYDGTISLPLVPDLNVNGMTREQAEETIRAAYQEVFKDPQLALSIQQAASKYYYVLGDVLNASKFPYENPLSVLAAINVAGGLRTSTQSQGQAGAQSPGTLTKAFIFRVVDGERKVIELDLSYLTQKGPHPSEVLVLPGDFVYIPEGVNLVYVLGEVRSANVFQLAEGQTLTQTLTRAGGPVESTAKIRNLILMREIDDARSEVMVIDWKEMLRTGQDIVLVPGDVIYVPRKGLVKLGEFVSRVTGPLSQVMSLYSQFWSTYNAKDINDVLVNTSDDTNAVTALQNVRNFGQLLQEFQSTGTDLTP